MTALIARQNVDTSKADTPNGVNVANFALGTGNLWDCIQTIGVGVGLISSGTVALTQANAGLNLIDASAGAVVINLPACSAAIGVLFQFKRIDNTPANSVTINRAGSDTIDGQSSIVLAEQLDFLEIRSDGTSIWRLLNNSVVAAKELLTSGTLTAYTIAPAQALNAYKTGRSFWVHFHAVSGAAPTLQISGLATPPNLVKQLANGTYANIAAGDITLDHRSRVTLLSATQALVETLPLAIANGSITAAKLDGAQSGSAPIFGERAWVNFNGTGTVAIRASGNVSSITDNGTGDYTVNFITSLPSADYVPSVNCQAPSTSLVVSHVFNSVTAGPTLTQSAPSASAFRFSLWATGGAPIDPVYACVKVTG